MKRTRSNRVILTIAILWTLAFCSVGYVVSTGLATKRWPGDLSKEELRNEGDQVVAAIEQYKATRGYYPETMQEAGIDGQLIGSHSNYGRRLDMKGYFVDVRDGPDQWGYESVSDKWVWESGVYASG